MSINYYLVKNKLPAALSPYSARIKILKNIDFKALAKRMAKGNTTVSEPDILAVLSDAVIHIEDLLLEGYRINFGDLCHLYPRIKGNFETSEDPFDSSKHELTAGARASSHLKALIGMVGEPDLVEVVENAPRAMNYHDQGSSSMNATMTGNDFGTITGKRLRFDKTQADEGVFLVDSLDSSEKIRATNYHTNTPGKIIFMVPSGVLTSGEGFMEVHSRGGKPTAEVKSSRLEDKMTSA